MEAYKSEERSITMMQFKSVVEDFKSDLKRITEVMLHEFGAVKTDIQYLKNKVDSHSTQLQYLKHNVDSHSELLQNLKIKADSHSEQIALLHEGQTEIKNILKQKPGQDEFGKLEMRVAKLESKVA
jgi:uncharacterized protein YllA (UPF0747 family)